MFRRAFIAALLAATPSLAQPVAAPDCTVDGRLTDSDGLRLDITYRCRATQPLSFRSVEDRAGKFHGKILPLPEARRRKAAKGAVEFLVETYRNATEEIILVPVAPLADIEERAVA